MTPPDSIETRQVFGDRDEAWRDRPRVYFCATCGTKTEERVLNGLPRDVCPKCGRVHWVNPTPAVAVVVVEGEHVLLCKRSSNGWHGAWCLPSGHIEFNEDFITAGLRETREESGVEVEVTGIVSVVSNFWQGGGNTLVPVLLARAIGGAPHGDGVETSEAAWFDYHDLPVLCFEADRHIIERYFTDRAPAISIDAAYARLDPAETRPVPPPSSIYPR